MLTRFNICRKTNPLPSLVTIAIGLVLLVDGGGLHAEDEGEVRLLDRQAFDRITLNAANQHAKIDVQLLEFPDRKVPDPLPESGTLEVRRLSEPSVVYSLNWSAVAKIQQFEDLLLEEAENLVKRQELDEAFVYLDFLHIHYPKLDRLSSVTEDYLYRDAIHSFSQERFDESLAILLSLHDKNPRRRGLDRAVEGVSDKLIANHLANRDFQAAREGLELLRQGFSNLKLSNITTWEGKFREGAERQLNTAREEKDAERYTEARQALRRALAILPDLTEAHEMLRELDRISPQMVVAVAQHGTANPYNSSKVWANNRVGRLTVPRLIEMVGFGAEGGNYGSRWADISADDAGLRLDVTLNSQALEAGITPESLAVEILRVADPRSESYREDFASVFSRVEINRGQTVSVHWLHSHVRPEALLDIPLSRLINSGNLPGEYRAAIDPEEPATTRYDLVTPFPWRAAPQVVVERAVNNSEAVQAALSSGDVDVVDKLGFWEQQQLRDLPGVSVASYRLPTVHVLIPNYSKPLLNRREFRRALCYGIDRQRILNEIVLGGQTQAGFRVLSAPLPAGIAINDSVGYAYKQDLQPRPYEPRLAAVLATIANTAIAKQAEGNGDPSAETEEGEEAKPPAKMEPLVLAHPPEPIVRAACQMFERQLSAIGIPVKLVELSANSESAHSENVPEDWDLMYTELTMWEPLVDARRLLGPSGLAGRCSPPMNLALMELDRATNWNNARAGLHRVHQVAFDDLPVIPLWQTVNYFAYRTTLEGIGDRPVSLYQNIPEWTLNYGESGR